jgi:pimeloyl-ACP methyl ester carboxylesterase
MIYERNDSGRRRPIGYEVHGEGPAILLLHAFPFDRRLWLPLHGGALADSFRLIAVDARGFGDSAVPEADAFSLDDVGDDAVALLDHLGVISAAVVGCSLGGYVALSIAARHAARLSALVLVDTRADADGELARQNRDAAIAEIRAHGAGAYLDGVATRLCGRSSLEPVRQEVQRLAVTAAADPTRALPPMLAAMRERADHTALLSRLRLPALIVAGDEDSVAPPDVARAMHAALPGSLLSILPGCGHLPPVEQPEAFRAVLERFLLEALLPV